MNLPYHGAFTIVASLALCVSGAIGCHPKASGDSAVPRAADTTNLAALRAHALALVGEPSCTDVSQCRLIAFGAKPCGGPWRFLLYSTATTDSVQLQVAVSNYNARETELNRVYHRTSDCSVVPRPHVTVINGRCELAP